MTLDLEKVKNTVARALAEDLGTGDVTSQVLMLNDVPAQAYVRSGKSGIICGLDVARLVFELVDPELNIMLECSDGDHVEPGQTVMNIEGKARSILAGERVMLNFLNMLSGTATLTYQFVQEVKDLPVKILDTRKTIPGLRYLQKYAVRVGGGRNHRMGLWDQVLIKDNHLQLTRVDEALTNSKDAGVPVEIECSTLDEVREALNHTPDWIMLDNMSVEMLTMAVNLVANRVKTEASGGVNLGSVRKIAETGVDAISVGALTHSSPFNALDLSLDMRPYENRTY